MGRSCRGLRVGGLSILAGAAVIGAVAGCASSGGARTAGASATTASRYPPAPASGQAVLSRADAVTVALHASSVMHPGHTVALPTDSDVTSAVEMKYGEIADSKSAVAASATPVWRIVVHAPVYTDGGPAAPPTLRSSYSVTLDAVNGNVIDYCIGCTR